MKTGRKIGNKAIQSHPQKKEIFFFIPDAPVLEPLNRCRDVIFRTKGISVLKSRPVLIYPNRLSPFRRFFCFHTPYIDPAIISSGLSWSKGSSQPLKLIDRSRKVEKHQRAPCMWSKFAYWPTVLKRPQRLQAHTILKDGGGWHSRNPAPRFQVQKATCRRVPG